MAGCAACGFAPSSCRLARRVLGRPFMFKEAAVFGAIKKYTAMLYNAWLLCSLFRSRIDRSLFMPCSVSASAAATAIPAVAPRALLIDCFSLPPPPLPPPALWPPLLLCLSTLRRVAAANRPRGGEGSQGPQDEANVSLLQCGPIHIIRTFALPFYVQTWWYRAYEPVELCTLGCTASVPWTRNGVALSTLVPFRA